MAVTVGQLKYFAAVVYEGAFTRATEHLHVSQPKFEPLGRGHPRLHLLTRVGDGMTGQPTVDAEP